MDIVDNDSKISIYRLITISTIRLYCLMSVVILPMRKTLSELTKLYSTKLQARIRKRCTRVDIRTNWSLKMFKPPRRASSQRRNRSRKRIWFNPLRAI